MHSIPYRSGTIAMGVNLGAYASGSEGVVQKEGT